MKIIRLVRINVLSYIYVISYNCWNMYRERGYKWDYIISKYRVK